MYNLCTTAFSFVKFNRHVERPVLKKIKSHNKRFVYIKLNYLLHVNQSDTILKSSLYKYDEIDPTLEDT